MAKDDDDNWTDPLDGAGEKFPKIVVELEKEEPRAEEKPAPKAPRQESEDEDDALSARVQKRINTLTRKFKESEEARVAQERAWHQEKTQLIQQVNEVTKRNNEVVRTSTSNHERQLKDKLALAQQSFEDAYDTGDKKKLSLAQMAIADATAELKLLEVVKVRMPKEEEDEGERERPQRQQPQRQVRQQQPHPKALAWVKENETWFGKDDYEVETAAALAIDQKLMKQGYDPSTDEFYEEVQKELSKKFPTLYDSEEKEEDYEPVQPPKKKTSQVVTGGSRTPGTQKVRLKQSEQDHARRLGVSLDVYAANKLKSEQAGDNYTNIF